MVTEALAEIIREMAEKIEPGPLWDEPDPVPYSIELTGGTKAIMSETPPT